jgi:hypothetical protein
MLYPFNIPSLSLLPCCFLAAILYEIQDSSKEAAGKMHNSNHEVALEGSNPLYLVNVIHFSG